MKLVYVHKVPLPGKAANTVNVAKMCAAFAMNGHKVTLVMPGLGWGFSSRISKVLVSYYDLRSSFGVVRFPLLRVKGGGRLFGLLAVLYARLSGAELMYTRDPISARMALLLGLRVIFEAHHSLDEYAEKSRQDFLVSAKQDNFSLVVISHALAEDFLHKLPWLKGRIVEAHDGADSVDTDSEAVHRSDEAGFSVAYAGHLYPGKGMEIIAPLVERCLWTDFHIYGGTPEDLSVWREKMSGMANIVFHGHVPHAELRRLLPRHDVVLAPYQHRVTISDGGRTDVARWMSPLKIFEYMSYGLPIVCSDLPVLREILRDGENAVLCSPDKVEEWEQALRRLQEDVSLRRALGMCAQKEFLASYTWEKRAETVLKGMA